MSTVVTRSGLAVQTTDEALLDAARSDTLPYNQPARLPLREVDMSLTVNLSELKAGMPWPPKRMDPRRQRMQVMWQIMRGDLSCVMDPREIDDSGIGGPTNFIGRISGLLASMCTREVPSMTGSAAKLSLMKKRTPSQKNGPIKNARLAALANSHIMDLCRQGAGFFLAHKGEDGILKCRWIDARRVWWTPDDDWVLVEPRTIGTPDTDAPNYLRVTHVDVAKGTAVEWLQPVEANRINPWQLKDVIKESESDLGDAIVTSAARPPYQPEGDWGTSLIESLIPPAVQETRRRASDTTVVDEHSKPLMLLRGVIEGFGSQYQSAATQNIGMLPDEIIQDARVGKLLRKHGFLKMQDGISSAEYLTWEGNLEASIAIQERIDRDIRFQSSVPAVLEHDGAVPSGMSLKRMFFVTDATAAELFEASKGSLEEVAEFGGVTLTWENTFEIVDADNREDVEDESKARRGEKQDPAVKT